MSIKAVGVLMGFVIYLLGIGALLTQFELEYQHAIYRGAPMAEVALRKPDFTRESNIKKRKALFFDYFGPLAERENSYILEARRQLLSVAESLTEQSELTRMETLRVYNIAQYYELNDFCRNEETRLDACVQRLLRRVNVIPVSLAQAQAAIESGWGTSRFAREANNFFGQWCFSAGCGLVPSHRSAGKKHEIRHFEHPAESLRAYLHNLNTFRAYSGFREQREMLVAEGAGITALPLLSSLGKYSERGDDYVRQVRGLILRNGLEQAAEP